MKERLTKLIREAQERYIYADEMAQHLIENGVDCVKQGEWVDTGDFELDNIYSGWKCSLCGHTFCGTKTNYCAGCGAKMEGGEG